MTAGAGVLMPRYSIQATQDPEAVYNRVCIVCHAGQLKAKVRARYGSAGATRDPGFQGDAAAWFVHGLQCRGLPVNHPVGERVSPAHNSLTLSRSWIS